MTLNELKALSSGVLARVHPNVREAAIRVLEAAYQRGILVRYTSGLRTNAEQAKLYAQGRTEPGKKVTNAKPGDSYHNYGLALDYVLLSKDGNRTPVWDVNKDWKMVASLAKAIGFEWGGEFKGFRDYPHLQMTFGLSIQDLKGGKRP